MGCRIRCWVIRKYEKYLSFFSSLSFCLSVSLSDLFLPIRLPISSFLGEIGRRIGKDKDERETDKKRERVGRLIEREDRRERKVMEMTVSEGEI